MSERNYVIILSTFSSNEEAETIGKSLLEKKLIACSNIVQDVSSLFWWQGKLDSADEVLMVMKTRRDLFDAVAEHIRALHSYDVPEIIAVPIIEGSKSYLHWIDETVC